MELAKKFNQVFCLPEKSVLEKILQVATLAPSQENNQPWRFIVSEECISLYYEDSMSLSYDKRHLLNHLSLGMLLENLRLAANHEGFDVDVEYFPSHLNPLEIASIHFKRATKSLDPIYHSIFTRRTDRRPYKRAVSLPASFFREVFCVQQDAGCQMSLTTDAKEIRHISNIICNLDSIRDLGIPRPFWLLPRGPLSYRNYIDLLENSEPLRLLLRRTKRQIISSSAIGIIWAENDSKLAMTKAGEAFQRLWLTAEKNKVSLQPITVYPLVKGMNVAEVSSLSDKDRDLIYNAVQEMEKIFPETKSRLAVAMFRLGISNNPPKKTEKKPERVPAYKKTQWLSNHPIMARSNNAQSDFDFENAFSRNIGLMNQEELLELKQKTIAIPSLGGVGGLQLFTLARMGVGGFHIADTEHFSAKDINHQYGAFMSTIGKNKNHVMSSLLLQINPETRLNSWDSKITEENVKEFLAGCDLLIDSLDASELETRRILYPKAQEMGIPIINASPIGFSCSMFVTFPHSMSFDGYIDYSHRKTREENFLKYMLKVAPRPYFLEYLDTKEVDGKNLMGSSCSSTAAFCAGISSTEALKILLGRSSVKGLPYYHHFDPYLLKFKTRWMPFGNRNPIQKALYFIARRKMLRKKPGNQPA